MSAEWHYFKDRERAGPVSEDKLKELVQDGRLFHTDQLWKEGMANWTKASEALPGLFAAQPPPLPTESSSSGAGLVGRALKLVLDEEWQKFLDDAWKAWRATSRLKKALVAVIVLAVVGITLWLWIARLVAPTQQEAGIWSRLWDGGVMTGLASLVFAFLKKKLESPGEPVAVAGGGEATVVPDDGFRFLGLSKQQCLGVLVALFIPTLLVSLVSAFLVGSQVHLWLTGPLLVLLGLALSVLCLDLRNNSKDNSLFVGVVVGGSALLLYAVTCINTRWVLLFYTLVVTFPTLHLFTLARRQMQPIRLSPSLLTGFGVVGLALVLGITALPRNEKGQQGMSFGIDGTWVKSTGQSNDTVEFTKGGQLIYIPRYASGTEIGTYTGRYVFIDSQTMEISNQYSSMRFQIELTPDNEMVLTRLSGQVQPFDMLAGKLRLVKDGQSDGGKKKKGDLGVAPTIPQGPENGELKPGPKDVEKNEPPKLDSPLAPKLVGAWQGVGDGNKGFKVRFTKLGKAEYSRPSRHFPRQTDTTLGSYSFRRDAQIQLNAAGRPNSDEGYQIEVEFLTDDEILLVNHSNSLGGFGTLAGQYKRAK